MNTEKTIIQNKQNNNSLSDSPFFQQGTQLGITAGVGMSLYLFALEALGLESSIGMKFIKYFILLGVLWYGMSTFKNNYFADFSFKKGAIYGGIITLTSALVLIGFDGFAWITTDEFGFNKFGLESSGFGNFITIAAIIFLETFVYGMIITFIILQSFKKRKPLI